MKRTFKNLFLSIALAAAACFAALQPAQAATPNIAVGAGDVVVFPLQISGQWTTSTTAVVRLKMPFPCYVLGVSATARASGGTSPTLTVDVLDAGTSILSAPISVTAGSVAEGTLTTTSIPDEDVVTVNLAIGGTTPTWNDITVLVTAVRK